MKKQLLAFAAIAALGMQPALAETVTTNGKTYEITTLIDRDLGPGVHYTRLRLPDYPLNVNMLRIDVTNPYNSMEVTQANDKLYGTESLVTAAKRQTTDTHVALAGANANFWCVSGQPPYSDYMTGVTFNGNLKNGKIITETNSDNDKYNGGLKHTGIVGITADKLVYSGNQWKWAGSAKSDAFGEIKIYQSNKAVRPDECGMYNSFYASRAFLCVNQYTGETDGKQHFEKVTGDATEVLLTMDPGQEWSAGDDMTFTVVEVNENAGGGTLGGNDLALVGRGDNATKLAALKAGDKVTLNYSWINPDGQRVKMSNLIGGNAQVMLDSEMTTYATSETYNSQVYSRTGYGASADNKTLYVIVIDKATDPVYGASAGCSVTVMCDIAKLYGCVNMTNFDAGGSAEMLVNGAIINKTTEGSPRAVANGMIAYSIAPVDNVITRLEFDDYTLKAPIYASYQPRILGYNQYGALVDDNVQGVTLSCPAEAGTCEGSMFTAGGKGVVSTLTATLGNVSVTKAITISEAQLALRIKPILIDATREYPMEVNATVDNTVYTYNPASISWTSSDPSVAYVDAEGVLRGLKNGTVTLTGQIGDFSDATEVTVEIAEAPKAHLDQETIDPSTWKFSYTSAKNGVMTAMPDGGFSFTYNVSSTRGPKVTVAKDIVLYSLPDAFEFDVNPCASTVNSITINTVTAQGTRLAHTFDVTLKANEANKITVPLADFCDHHDLITFPLTFKSIAFSLGGTTGNYSIEVPSAKVIYNNYTDGIEDITAPEANGAIDMLPGASVEYYTLQGVRLGSRPSTPGLYIRRVGQKAEKFIIR